MIAQQAVDIGPEETAGELEARLAPLGARLALESIEKIVSGTTKPLAQDRSLVSKAPKLKKDDGLIDWSRTSAQVCNQIRAMQPWPTAYTFLHRQGQPPMRVIVNRAGSTHIFWDESAHPLPGMLFMDDQIQPGVAKLIVVTGGSGGVIVSELQPAGKRRMPATEFLRGHPLREGDRFGPEQL
jgi:methionyl-tRNA formyltransferase